MKSFKAIYIPTGITVEVYKHKERKTFVDTANYTTEYPENDIQKI